MRHAALAALVLCTTALTTNTRAHGAPRRARRAVVARAATSPPPAPLDTATRRLRMLDAFARSGHIRRCWMQQLQRDPRTPARTLAVRLAVDEGGRARGVTVADPDAPGLARCLAAGAWSLAPVGAGEPFEAEGTLHLDRPE
jgi:hypothetical protein